jgi:hypothetical protein
MLHGIPSQDSRKRINVELKLASLRSSVENVLNVPGGMLGEIISET